MANYNFSVDATFQPFTMQEMLIPFTAYKEAYEKTEDAYDALADSEKFQYLSRTLPEGSKAREIYEGYAKDLKRQAEDLSSNGLNMSNRSALSSLKRRYKGEIGSLVQADEAMKEEKNLRKSLNAQDPSRLYATDNLTIDDFLNNNTPNLYSVSGNDLYTRGAQAAKASSSRVFNIDGTQKTLGGYYLDFAQSVGYDANLMKAFRENLSAIPELAATADAILEEKGVLQNLTGVNLQRARQSVINGMIDGAVYTENHSPQRDLSKIDAATQAQLDLTRRGQNISLASSGLTYDDKTGTITYDIDKDPSVAKATAIANAKKEGKLKSGEGTPKDNRLKTSIMVGASGKIYRDSNDENNNVGEAIDLSDIKTVKPLGDDDASIYDAGDSIGENLRNAIGNGDLRNYQILKIPRMGEGNSNWLGRRLLTEDIYILSPLSTSSSPSNVKDTTSEDDGEEAVPVTQGGGG